MPNLKIAFLTVLVLLVSVGLIGCGMLSSQEEEPEEFTAPEEGGLPEWLNLEHRSIEWETAEPLKPKDTTNDEDDNNEEQDLSEPELPEETTQTEPTQAAQRQEQPQPAQEPDTQTEEQAQEPEVTRVSNKEWQRGKYTGAWVEDSPHGEGTFEHPDGGKLSGTWVRGNPDGQFTKTNPDGTTETVYFAQGQIQEGPAEGEATESRWWEQESSSPSGSTF